jgi:hypothetical protein
LSPFKLTILIFLNSGAVGRRQKNGRTDLCRFSRSRINYFLRLINSD